MANYLTHTYLVISKLRTTYVLWICVRLRAHVLYLIHCAIRSVRKLLLFSPTVTTVLFWPAIATAAGYCHTTSFVTKVVCHTDRLNLDRRTDRQFFLRPDFVREKSGNVVLIFFCIFQKFVEKFHFNNAQVLPEFLGGFCRMEVTNIITNMDQKMIKKITYYLSI